MRLKVRAVIPSAGGIVVASERRRGGEHLTLPGGRVERGEGLAQALAREVREETDLEVAIGPLLYLAEVVTGSTRHELNVVFLVEPTSASGGSGRVITADDPARSRVMPPILDVVFADLAAAAPPTPRFLGNVYVPGL